LLQRTGSTPADIDAVCLHGTGTVRNDRYEARGLRTVMGERGDSQRGFSVKGGIGHLLGAAGSVETVFSVLALHEQVLPPTINCEHPAEDCPFPVTGAAAVRQPVRTLLKLSLGFGGHLAAGILRRVEERPATREHPRTP
jgi:3-oxoacyl-(acyl-carrier-protein) synthase